MVTRFAKFHHSGKSLPVFGKFLTVYFLFGKILNLLLQICDIIGLIITVANGQIWKNNLTIRTHCPFPRQYDSHTNLSNLESLKNAENFDLVPVAF